VAPSVASEAPSASGSAEPSGAASPGGSAGEGAALTIAATEFKFETAASVPAGPVTIRLTNEGQEEHQAQMARIAEGSTFDDVIAALQQADPSGAFAILTFVGGPTGVTPGEEQEVRAVLEPGNHILLCFVSGADGVPHFAKGMAAQFEVTAPAATGELPTGDAQLTLQDFAFVGLDRLPTGRQVVHVTNNGPQPHEAGIVKLSEGVTVEDLFSMATASAPPSGPPPFESSGGIAALSPDHDGTMTVDLVPGEYAFVCFVPDPASGKPHIQLGMIGALTVE
jgi:uncharacterized cupredoxin-like copper-binding protein